MRWLVANVSIFAFLAAGVQTLTLSSVQLIKPSARRVFSELPARALARADKHSSVVQHGGCSGKFTDIGGTEGKSCECALQRPTDTTDVNSSAAPTDVFDHFQAVDHSNFDNFDNSHFFKVELRDTFVYPDGNYCYVDDNIDNTIHCQPDIARFHDKHRDRDGDRNGDGDEDGGGDGYKDGYKDGNGLNFYNINFLARNDDYRREYYIQQRQQ
ncbi:hypothetical protein ISF_07198 [Cordyceps fumosorosea ARSEF 2679]|uniref:Uncharacterized protein n=1 Tax=Cordyceps fumosorosea (strain ARSEF 2679) TaxID=1081104 RepID=A0A167Q4G6_CORFA|nr:hypothetical protein ISF_07198 [Cordyceps fumosorosea ARSEF 2679]OAA57277.1 hypothetical protein ISF_07198 [Cordyceps fumosorosea ARSEF 2679]